MSAVEIRATIPGTVSELSVPDGAAVADGETIGQVECMKTLWAFTAPAAGIVRFQVTLGEMVAQDQVLATIEAAT